MTRPTVELSVAATSEELALLSAAAQKRRMSLRDFLRLQVMAAAKLAAKSDKADVLPSPTPNLGLAETFTSNGLRPVFLP
jgi:hypothetical protein